MIEILLNFPPFLKFNFFQNVFEGMHVYGNADVTISNGKVVWENGQFNVEAGSGRFIHVKPFCDYVFGTVKAREEVKITVMDD